MRSSIQGNEYDLLHQESTNNMLLKPLGGVGCLQSGLQGSKYVDSLLNIRCKGNLLHLHVSPDTDTAK